MFASYSCNARICGRSKCKAKTFGGYRTFWHAAETQVHDRYSGDVIAKHPRLQILTQGLKFSDLTEQLDFLGTIRQLRHATLVRTDPAHDARVKQPNDEFGRLSALIIGRLAQLHVDFLRLLRRAFRIGVARRQR